MTATFEKKGTNDGVLKFTIAQDEIQKGLTTAFNKVKKSLNVPGFRKGKVSRQVFNRMYGEEALYEDALNAVLPEAYEAAVKEAGIDPVSQPKIDVESMEKGQDWVITAEVTVKPEVKLGQYKDLVVEKQDREVTDADVDARIKREQEAQAELVIKEDAAAENGDTVVIDFEGFVDGEAFDGGKGENYSLTLGSGQFIPGFEEQVAGHKIDEDFDVTVTFPEDYQMTDYAGKEAVFKCKIHSISKEEIPELTDDFVKEISDFDTVDEWKADAKKKLEENAEQTAKVGFENALVAKLIDKVQDPIPHCMFEQRADGMMDAFANQLKGQNVDLDLYLQYTGMTKDQLKETYLERAENEVKLRLALEKIAELEGLEVADEELDAELTKLAEQYNMTLDDVKARIPVAEYKLDMLVTKALDLVKDSAVVDNSEPAEAEKAEDKEAE